tara:strand:- start:68 stop:274 length:207 start_codon:yes stop_codon:yes gene_type:complete
MTNEKKHWTIVTANGTRWGVQGDSEQEVKDNFFGIDFGIEIARVEPVRIWSAEVDEELKREKAIWRSR